MMTRQYEMSAATTAKTWLLPSLHMEAAAGLCPALAPPWKQGRREIRRRAPLAPRAGRDRPRIGIGRDHLAIEMPSGMAEQRDYDGKAKEERQRSQNQQHRDDQPPRRHRYRV